MGTDLDSVFAPGGLLSRKMSGWEHRPQQRDLAIAVDEALRGKRHLDAEAPCGTGKTFAYLVPLIRHAVESDTRAVVCTANIALQEQIVGKDLPILQKILPWDFSFTLLKGIQNYLCLDRYGDALPDLAQESLYETPAARRAIAKFRSWADRTKAGDRSELEEEPARDLWRRACGITDLCNGSQCRFFHDCFAMEARRRAHDVRIVVTNYHLYFAHLAVRQETNQDVILPEHKVVVCDEGHEMADIARHAFGWRLTSKSVGLLSRGAKAIGRADLYEGARTASDRLFAEVEPLRRGNPYAVRLRGGALAGVPPFQKALEAYRRVLGSARTDAGDDELRDRLNKSLAAARRMEETLRVFGQAEEEGVVRYVEPDEEVLALAALRLDVAPVLDGMMFRDKESVITTSATLAAGGTFDFLKGERGGADARELVVPSPFDFERQCLTCVPTLEANDPNDPRFLDELSRTINAFVRKLGGRTMALFCSYRALEHCAARAGETGARILKQGEQPRTRLLETFRREAHGSALFATASFWHGVDIPGDALTCLVIDRIPFRPPDEPLTEAMTERREDAFDAYSLPRALLELRQGIGRLIRTKTDRGVVVLCDPRIYTRGYGRRVLASLPGGRVTRDVAEAFAFLEEVDSGRNEEAGKRK